MHPDSLLRLLCYINHLLTYLVTYQDHAYHTFFILNNTGQERRIQCSAQHCVHENSKRCHQWILIQANSQHNKLLLHLQVTYFGTLMLVVG